MKKALFKKSFLLQLGALSTLLLNPGNLPGKNEILGEVRLIGHSRIEKISGVWVNGQYVGYLKELKGSKKLLLLPGEHRITVRHGGYKDFDQKIQVEPGQAHTVQVTMDKNPEVQYPQLTAQVKISVKPNRAAVFVNGLFMGHVDEFDGPGQMLLIAPGKTVFKIALPGYQDFTTEVTLLANQKFQLKTELVPGSMRQSQMSHSVVYAAATN